MKSLRAFVRDNNGTIKTLLRWFLVMLNVGMRIAYSGERWSWRWKVKGQLVGQRRSGVSSGRRHEEVKHHGRYGRG